MYIQARRESFYIALLLQSVLLFFIIGEISLSPSEAKILHSEESIIKYIFGFLFQFIERSDYSLRIPFLLLHIINSILFFDIAKKFFKKEQDAFFASILFLLLPGINSAAILVSKAGIIIFATLIFLYLFLKNKEIPYSVLMIMALLDSAFSILFLSLVIYGAFKKDGKLLFFSILLFSFSMYFYGFDSSGKPKSHFLDTLGIYLAIFSPLLFLYFFYSIYRTLIKEEKNIIWFVVATSLFLSITLSFRQRIAIEDFAPFLVLGTILLTKTFFDGYRVRLPEFRGRYKIISLVVILFLCLNASLLFVNKFFYNFLENPKKHFAYNFHYSKDLAESLKELGVDFVTSQNSALVKQLNFYNIRSGDLYRIEEFKFDDSAQEVSILYNQIEISTFYVSKVNI